MRTPVRRRLALLGAGATTAVVAGVLVAVVPSPATAAPVVAVNPTAASNTAGTTNVTFTTTTPFPQAGDPTTGAGTQVVLVRTGTTGTSSEDKLVGSVVGNGTPSTMITATFTFAATSTQAPPNPGRYDAFVYVGNRMAGDNCTACFSLFSPTPTVSGVNVNSLPSGVQGQSYTVTGSNFARGTMLRAVLPGSTTADPSITFTDATQTANGQTTSIPNTATTIKKTIRVDPSASVGFRDLLVVNTDADPASSVGVARLVNGLRITGFDISSISPNAGANNQTVRAAVLGRGFPAGADVRLVNEATPTVGTIVGSGVDRISEARLAVNFDLTNALPGTYRVRVAAPDGAVSTPECSPTFTVVNVQSPPPSGRASTVDDSGFTCTDATVASPSPSASASPSVSGSASPSPSGSASPRPSPSSSGLPLPLPTGSASPSPSATATATTSPSPSGSVTPSASPSGQGPTAPTLSVFPATINCQATSRVTATADPGTRIDLFAYSRPSTKYVKVRSGLVSENGTVSFVVGPCGNTRLKAVSTNVNSGASTEGPSTVITVRTSINLKAARTGTRTYRFTGSTLPKRVNQLVTVFYEKPNGSRVIATRARVDGQGRYDVTRTFSGTGTFTFFTGTGTDINNAAGTSNRVRVSIR